MKVDTRALFALVIKKIPQTIVLALLFAVAAFGFSFMKPEIFSARAKIFIGQGGLGGGFDLQGISAWSSLLGKKSGEEQHILTILNSITLTQNVIKDLGLDKIESIIPPDIKDDPIKQAAAVSAIVNIESNNAGQITIGAKTSDPELSAKIANSYIDQLIKYYTESATKDKTQLWNLLEDIRETTLEIENKMLAMQGENEELLSLEDRSNQLIDTYAALTSKKMESEVTKRMLEGVRREAGSVAVASELNRRLLEQNAGLDVYNEFLSQYREKLRKLPATFIEYSRLKKDLAFYETLYSAILGKYESTEIKLKLGSDEFEVVDRAIPNRERESPIRRYFALAGFAIGLAVSALLFIFPKQNLFIIPVENAQKD